jgi:hypothetical protein
MKDLQKELQNRLPEIMASPRLYVHTLDLKKAAALIIDADQAFYKNAVSLDQRVLHPETKGAWVSLDVLWRHMDATARNYLAPANFIFHTGHCGSTQISRLLDELPSMLCLREPLMLRTLAAGLQARSIFGGAAFEETFKRAYQLLVRRFSPKQRVVIKPASMCNNLAPVLLAQNPANRGILLFVTLEVYLASVLDKADITDIDGLLGHRTASLKKIVPDLDLTVTTLSLPEKIAFGWLVEAAQLHLLSTRGLASRILLMDYDRFLAETEVQLPSLLLHLSIPAEQAVVDGLLTGPVFKSGSEQPGFAFTPAKRKAILDESRAASTQAIRTGIGFVERMMKIHPDLGELTEKIPLA